MTAQTARIAVNVILGIWLLATLTYGLAALLVQPEAWGTTLEFGVDWLLVSLIVYEATVVMRHRLRR